MFSNNFFFFFLKILMLFSCVSVQPGLERPIGPRRLGSPVPRRRWLRGRGRCRRSQGRRRRRLRPRHLTVRDGPKGQGRFAPHPCVFPAFLSGDIAGAAITLWKYYTRRASRPHALRTIYTPLHTHQWVPAEILSEG